MYRKPSATRCLGVSEVNITRCIIDFIWFLFVGQGVEQYTKMPIFQKSLQKFAADNDFEVRDVIRDGNCMFRAIADQLLINGCLGHTRESLRQTAVE